MSEKTAGTDTVEPFPQSAGIQELCGFHQFLQTWLADAKKARGLPRDLAIALLLQIFWETRSWTKDERFTGVAMPWSGSPWLRFGSQAEIHAALQNLAREGIIRLVPCLGESMSQDKKMKFMMIELPWRDADEE
jgi:hypothetical protein